MVNINNMKLIHIFILLYSMNIYNSSLEDKIGYNPYLKKLNNNKYIVISSKGITFLDETLTQSSNSITLEEEAYSEVYSHFSTTAVQFPEEDDNLILALLEDTIFIFDSNESLLISQIIISDYYSGNQFQKPYYLFPHCKINNTYTTIIIDLVDYELDFVYVCFQKLIYYYDNNTIILSEKISYKLKSVDFDYNDLNPKASIGCGVIDNYNNTKILNCIYGIKEFQIINFDPEKNFSIISKETYDENNEINIKFFKSLTLPNKDQIIHCLFREASLLKCIKYDIKTNSTTIFLDFPLDDYAFDPNLNMIYYEESEKIVISLLCINYQFSYKIFICEQEGNCIEQIYTEIGAISDFSNYLDRICVVIPKESLTYQIFAYNSEENILVIVDSGLEFDLICNKFYNYPKTSCLDTIPEGYFCNSTEDKTLDKCHENCKICNTSSTETNNNCLTCKEDMYYYLGNCLSNCSNSFYIDEIHNKTCKCINNIACFLCSEENLCLTCNTENGYYQKSDEEPSDDFVNCYKDPEGYYFLENKYHPCYSTCKKCEELGDSYNHKCIECKDGYTFIDDFENGNNCFINCQYYYYFDENNNYYCTETENCPPLYSKLIDNKKCVKNTDSTSLITASDTNFESTETVDSTYNFQSSYIFSTSLYNDTECDVNDYLKNYCNIPMNISNIIEIIKNSIESKEINDLLNDIINKGKNITKSIGKITLQLIEIENQKKDSNISLIDFGECEQILRDNYGLENSSILLYKIDIPIEGYSTISVQYELYETYNYTLLNLDYCNKSSINIHVPVKINENEVDKYNPSSEFYNDICYPHSNENGADVILVDRKNEFIDNNLTLCDDDCEFKEYDSINEKAICKCKVKKSMDDISDIKNINSEKFFVGWINIENYINISVLKCIKLLSTKKGFLKNIGNFFLLSVILLFIASAGYFIFKGFPKLKSIINQLKDDVKFDLKLTRRMSYAPDSKIDITINPENSKSKKRISIKKRKIRKSYVNRQNKNLILSQNSRNKLEIFVKNQNPEFPLEEKKEKEGEKKGEKEGEKEGEKKEEKEEEQARTKKLNDHELNSLDYKDAIKLDKRTYLQYYWSLIKTKHILIFTFLPTKDYNSYIIKIELFLFSVSLYLTISALFFTDETIHKIYEDNGIFNFVYNIPQILYSTIISAVINMVVKSLSLTENKILEIKMQKTPKEVNSKASEIIKCLKLKFILFYIISGIFLSFFWLYISCFCAVYRNTQNHLIKDTIFSFLLSLLYPFALNLIPIFIRIPAIRSKNSQYIYKVSKIVQII